MISLKNCSMFDLEDKETEMMLVGVYGDATHVRLIGQVALEIRIGRNKGAAFPRQVGQCFRTPRKRCFPFRLPGLIDLPDRLGTRQFQESK